MNLLCFLEGQYYRLSMECNAAKSKSLSKVFRVINTDLVSLNEPISTIQYIIEYNQMTRYNQIIMLYMQSH